MDQAITTLRIAWRRRTLFVRPLALPLVVADSGAPALWLPTPAALRLAAAITVAAVVVIPLVIVADTAFIGLLLRPGTTLIEVEPMIRFGFWLIHGLDWRSAVATIAAIAAARRSFPDASGHAPPPGIGRFAVAALLVLAVIYLVDREAGSLLGPLLEGLAGADLGSPLVMHAIAAVDAAGTVVAMAIAVPVIAMAIAVAAFAGRTAARV